MENFGPQGALGRWAGGFSVGQLWVEEAWDRFLAGAGSDAALEEELGALNVALSFFTHQELAEKFRLQMPDQPSLEEAARRALAVFPAAMRALAEIGRGLEEPRRGGEREPARSAKVGRNVPCPCGSGRKYKRCCGCSRAVVVKGAKLRL